MTLIDTRSLIEAFASNALSSALLSAGGHNSSLALFTETSG